MPDFSIGVDLGGTNLRIAAISTEGQLLEKVTLSTNSLGPDHVVDEMCNAIRLLTDKYRNAGSLLGAGIGIPGIIDLEAGVVCKSANLPGWSGYPVRAEIERRLGKPILLENDAKVAALGEKWLGAGRDVNDMAMITLGTGIGGCIILNGKIFHGMNGMAGEFGHVTIEPDGVPCGCGNHGCAERYASATAIVRMAREAITSGEAPSLAKSANSDAEFGPESIYKLAKEGDAAAQRIFERFGIAFGIMLAGLINVLNLEMYVIGGGVSSAWDAFAPRMFQELRERSLIYAATAPDDPMSADSPNARSLNNEAPNKKPGSSTQNTSVTRRKTIITRAVLGSDAGLYGAARVLALEKT